VEETIKRIIDKVDEWKPYRFSVKAKTENDVIIGFTGPQVRACFLRAISSIDSKLAEELHSPNTPAPYSVIPIAKIEYQNGKRILKFSDNLKLKKNESVMFSITLLSRSIYERLNISKLLGALGTRIQIGNTNLAVSSFYIDRLEVRVDTIPNVKRFQVYFETPTFFRRKSSNYRALFPDPPVIFPSIARIFGKLLEVKLDIDAIKEEVSKNVGVLSYNLHTTKTIDIGRGRKIVGFVGKCIYECANEITARLVYVLLKIGEIMNVGGSRTLGFGVIKCKPTKA